MAQKDLNGKTCLVVGASGFIGKQLCSVLSKRGATVKTLLHAAIDDTDNNSYACNLGFDEIPAEAMDSVDTVFHLAGRAHSLADSADQEKLYYQINVEGTRTLLKAAKLAGVKKFIFFSSIKAMGEDSDLRIDESFESKPLSAYGISKLEAENLVLSGGYVKSPVVLRLAMVYGNACKGNLPKMIKAIYKNRFPPFPKIQNKRSMIHVEDVVTGAIRVALSDVGSGEVYILSDGVDYSTREIYESICKALGRKIPNWSVPKYCLFLIAKFGYMANVIIGRRLFFDTDNLQKLIGNSYFSSKKIMKEIGFSPKHTLFNSIPDMILAIDLE